MVSSKLVSVAVRMMTLFSCDSIAFSIVSYLEPFCQNSDLNPKLCCAHGQSSELTCNSSWWGDRSAPYSSQDTHTHPLPESYWIGQMKGYAESRRGSWVCVMLEWASFNEIKKSWKDETKATTSSLNSNLYGTGTCHSKESFLALCWKVSIDSFSP